MTLSHTLNPIPKTAPTEPDTSQTLWKAERSGGKAEVRLSINRYRGRQFFVLREWYRSRKGGEEFLPSKRGTTIRPEEASALLRAFGDALPEIIPKQGN